MNRGWAWMYIVKKGIIRRVQGYKCLKTPIKMEKKRSSNHQAHLTGQGAIFGSCKLPKKYRKFLFSFVNSEAMENFCKLLDFANFWKLYWKAIFWLPVERLVLNTKNNGSGCHQLFFWLKEKQRPNACSCQYVSSRCNFEIVGGIRAARALLSNSPPKTYSEGAETAVTEENI